MKNEQDNTLIGIRVASPLRIKNVLKEEKKEIIEDLGILYGNEGHYIECCEIHDPKKREGITTWSCQIKGLSKPVKNILVNTFRDVQGKKNWIIGEPGRTCHRFTFEGNVECWVYRDVIAGLEVNALSCINTGEESPFK